MSMLTLEPDHVYEAQQRLVELLKKQGYTTEIPRPGPYYYPLLCPCALKPIRVFHSSISKIITILHSSCCNPVGSGLTGYEHDAEFLKELIPVIGKLDAHAELDPGDA